MALLQSAAFNSSGSVSSLAGAFPNNVTAGSLLLAFVATLDVSTNTLGCSDSVNGTYNTDLSPGGSNGMNGAFFSFPNASGGSQPTVTATTTSNSSNMHLIIEEHSTVNTSTPLDQKTHFNGANGTTNVETGTTSTTAQADELIIAAVFMTTSEGPTTLTAGGSFTVDSNSNMGPSSSGRVGLMYWYATNGPTTYTGSGTMGESITTTGGLIATYKYTASTTVQTVPAFTLYGLQPLLAQ